MVAACHNGAESVTISGPCEELTIVMNKMMQDGKVVRVVDSANVAFHSPELEPCREGFKNAVRGVSLKIIFHLLSNVESTNSCMCNKHL